MSSSDAQEWTARTATSSDPQAHSKALRPATTTGTLEGCVHPFSTAGGPGPEAARPGAASGPAASAPASRSAALGPALTSTAAQSRREGWDTVLERAADKGLLSSKAAMLAGVGVRLDRSTTGELGPARTPGFVTGTRRRRRKRSLLLAKKANNRWLRAVQTMQRVFGRFVDERELDETFVETPYMVHPDTSARHMWDIGLVIALLVSVLTVPVEVGFSVAGSFTGTPGQQLWATIDMILTVFFFIDIIVQFRTAVVVDDEVLMDNKAVTMRYLTGWFTVDLLATIPFDDILRVMMTDDKASWPPSLLWTLKAMRLLRMLRVIKLQRIIHAMSSTWSQTMGNVGRIALVAFWIAVCGHVLACAWFLLAVSNGIGSGTWADDFMMLDMAVGSQYVISVYWAFVTVTTVGYGDITPANNIERVCVVAMGDPVFVVVCSFLSQGILAYLVGRFSALAQQMNAGHHAYTEKLDAVNEFMRHRKLPAALRKRIREFYHSFWSRGIYFDENAILGDLTFQLRQDVGQALSADILNNVPFLKTLDPSAVKVILSRLVTQHALPGDAIVREGDFGAHLFIVRRGVLSVSKGGVKCHYLTQGGFFGEVCLVYPERRRTATVRAVTAVELAALHVDDFGDIAMLFPPFGDVLRKVADAHLTFDDREKRILAEQTKRTQRHSSSGSGIRGRVSDMTNVLQTMFTRRSKSTLGSGEVKEHDGRTAEVQQRHKPEALSEAGEIEALGAASRRMLGGVGASARETVQDDDDDDDAIRSTIHFVVSRGSDSRIEAPLDELEHDIVEVAGDTERSLSNRMKTANAMLRSAMGVATASLDGRLQHKPKRNRGAAVDSEVDRAQRRLPTTSAAIAVPNSHGLHGARRASLLQVEARPPGRVPEDPRTAAAAARLFGRRPTLDGAPDTAAPAARGLYSGTKKARGRHFSLELARARSLDASDPSVPPEEQLQRLRRASLAGPTAGRREAPATQMRRHSVAGVGRDRKATVGGRSGDGYGGTSRHTDLAGTGSSASGWSSDPNQVPPWFREHAQSMATLLESVAHVTVELARVHNSVRQMSARVAMLEGSHMVD